IGGIDDRKHFAERLVVAKRPCDQAVDEAERRQQSIEPAALERARAQQEPEDSHERKRQQGSPHQGQGGQAKTVDEAGEGSPLAGASRSQEDATGQEERGQNTVVDLGRVDNPERVKRTQDTRQAAYQAALKDAPREQEIEQRRQSSQQALQPAQSTIGGP